MEPRTTKERILDAAIGMFAEKGYDLVSMRDIASELRIKASSIYNHYPSKAEILKAIIELFGNELGRRRINEWREEIGETLRSKGPVSVIVEMMTAPLSLLEDPLLMQIIRILTRAQFHDDDVRTFLLEELILKPHVFLKELVVRAGIAADGPYDEEFIAAELQSPMTSYFYQLSLTRGYRVLDAAAIRAAVERHTVFVLSKLRGIPRA